MNGKISNDGEILRREIILRTHVSLFSRILYPGFSRAHHTRRETRREERGQVVGEGGS
jgi:hypothetical protein